MRGILGADIFVNLLLVFIITTGVLLMNTNKASKVHIDKRNEQNLPEIQLPQGKSKSLLPDYGLMSPMVGRCVWKWMCL